MASGYHSLYAELRDDVEEIQRQIAAVVVISPTDVTQDLLTQAQRFMEWAYYHALAEDEVRRLKVELEETALPEAKRLAERILTEQGRKVTVASLEETAFQDENYRAVREKYLDAQARASILRRVIEALWQKKDMIQSLNARHRVELAALPQDIPPVFIGDRNTTSSIPVVSLPWDLEDENEELEKKARARMRALKAQRGETA